MTDTIVDVRRLEPDDWQAFREIRLRALAEDPDGFAVTLTEVQDLPEARWRQRLGGPIFLVVERGRPVAMGGGWAPEGRDDYFVWGMWTAPEARGRGHATRLPHTVLGAPESLGRRVFLHVTVGNDSARRLYLAHGFEPTGEVEPLREGSPLRVELMRYAG